METHASKAVFLSYASQDAEAARRIAEALRPAGIEVWFDQEGGLEHGDEWDAKIRHQIKECVLFLPLISANTQARLEGYFRIEWELATERAMGIAHGVPFILPVVIDDTREPEALVPERFHKVQWMRLAGGNVTPEAQARFLKLWSHRTGALRHASEKVGAGPDNAGRAAVDAAEGAGRSRLRIAFWAIGACTGIAAAVFVVGKLGKKAAPPATQTTVSATVPLSEARQLVAKAWTLLNKATGLRAELEAADDLCKRAATLDSTDAEVLAAWSQVGSWLIYHGLDETLERQEAARANAARALQLAPDSFEARLAQACYWVRGRRGSGSGAVSEYATDAEALLRTLLQERSAEPRALYALGILQRNVGKGTEARATFEELARNPAYAVVAWNEIGWAAWIACDYRAAEVAADKSIALQSFWGNLTLKLRLAIEWHGDLPRGKAILDQLPRAFLQEEGGAMIAYDCHYLRRDPINMLRVLDEIPREWLTTGPTAHYRGWAQKLAGKDELAQIEWRAAQKLVEQRLADKPNAPELLRIKGALLARMGDRAEAGRLLRLARELRKDQDPLIEAYDRLLLEQFDDALALIEKSVKDGPRREGLTAARLRLEPHFDPLRAHPRFQALLARLEADPRFSPDAKEPAQKGVTP